MFDDFVTSSEKWLDIVQICQKNGYNEPGIEILTAVTVLGAMRNASDNIRELHSAREAPVVQTPVAEASSVPNGESALTEGKAGKKNKKKHGSTYDQTSSEHLTLEPTVTQTEHTVETNDDTEFVDSERT